MRGSVVGEDWNGESAGTGAVRRALGILSCFTMQTPERGVSEISAELGLPKATVHRLLVAMTDAGYVEQVPATGKYRLGVTLLGLGAVVASNLSYQEKALPHLRRLVDEVDETVVVAVLDGLSHVCTLVVEPRRPVRVTTAVGIRRL